MLPKFRDGRFHLYNETQRTFITKTLAKKGRRLPTNWSFLPEKIIFYQPGGGLQPPAPCPLAPTPMQSFINVFGHFQVVGCWDMSRQRCVVFTRFRRFFRKIGQICINFRRPIDSTRISPNLCYFLTKKRRRGFASLWKHKAQVLRVS